MHVLDPVQLLLNGLPQHWAIDHLENKERFGDLPKGLQRPIEGVLLGVGVKPAEQIRS